MVARDGDRLIWDYEIGEAAGAAGVVPMPLSPTEAPEAGEEDLVTPKVQPNRRRAKE